MVDLNSLSPWTWTLVAIAATLLLHEVKTRRKRAHNPPGPPPLPFIGNALDVPAGHPGRAYHEMSKKYGELVYLNALGQPMLVIGSYKAARDLLDKKSSNYSDRPQSVMINLTGMDSMFTLKNYGSQWRLHRRVFHQSFNAEVVDNYQPIQLTAARRLLAALRRSPDDVTEQVRFTFASILLRVAYGIDVVESNNEYYERLEQINAVGEAISVPGRFPVEAIPSLVHLPSWFPGAGFKKYAADAKTFLDENIDKIYETAVSGLNAGVARDSFVSRLLDDASSLDLAGGGESDLETFIKHLTITIYAAGADTTYNTLQAFLLAISMHPDVQKRAQEELDRVVGHNRLPEFDDRPSLPYIAALLKEVTRWHVGTPIGLPHRTTADDNYNGYFIPAGTIVMPNLWSLAHNAELFPEPEKFKPERFLNADGELDPTKEDLAGFVFGFGRRVCPGRPFAEASLFIIAASLLHAFEIGPPLDASGAPQKLEHKDNSPGVVSHPEVYNYSIKHRFARAEELIMES